ncbi:hypothetical protein BZZ01_32650 [Nostocales cyanobacterium HT-58-2]|nr:hypothetical protein BZZ01_32650 [Nostocales cyanobacterium HT-58-2]
MVKNSEIFQDKHRKLFCLEIDCQATTLTFYDIVRDECIQSITPLCPKACIRPPAPMLLP